MFPVLTVLFPGLARVAAQYRFDRLSAAEANAAAAGYDGAMWPWESASTGLWTSIDPRNDLSENHISADIPLAHRRFFLATGDRAFLEAAWPSLNATCRFWECRFTR
jgi:protein-glucosylgalactosylhydroxylysine glucosidase